MSTSTITVNGKTINLSRDSEAKEVYDVAVAEYESSNGTRPSSRTAAKTWDSDLNTYVVQALQELLDQRSAAAEDTVSEAASTDDSAESEYETTGPSPPPTY